MLYLMAADDVFGSLKTLPAAEIEQSPWLSAIITPRGGHLGFVDGWLWPRPPFYSERVAVAYVRGLLELVRGPLGTKALHSLVDSSVHSLFQPAGEKMTATCMMPRLEDQEVAAAETPSGENRRNQEILRTIMSV